MYIIYNNIQSKLRYLGEFEATIAEEYEVLESIYPEELEKISENELKIRLLPDEEIGEPLKVDLRISYTQQYPNELPEYEIEIVEGTLSEDELNNLKDELNTIVSACNI